MPPRLAIWLLSWRLPPEDRDDIIGDLNEEFADRASSGRGARGWYWRQAFRVAWAISGDMRRRNRLFPEERRAERALILRDVLHAARRLVKQPLGSLASIAALASAIGAVTVTWTLLSATLLHPLDVDKPEQVFVVGTTSFSASGPVSPAETHLSVRAAAEVRASGAFAESTATGSWTVPGSLAGNDEQLHVAFLDPNFFQVVGLPMESGRDFSALGDGASLPVILAARTWERVFGRDTSVMGRRIEVRALPAVVVGIAPAGFPGVDLAQPPDVFLPMSSAEAIAGPSSAMPGGQLPLGLQVIGRVPAGDSSRAIEARLAALPSLRGRRPVLVSLEDAALAAGARPSLTRFMRLLEVAVSLLLLAGSVTVGMLVLIRTEARRDEFAICLALGASRGALARGVAIEGVLVALAAGVAALPAAALFLGALKTFEVPGGIAIDALNMPLSAYSMLTAAGAGVAAALVIGIIGGAFGLTRPAADVLRARSGSTPRVSRRATRSALIIGQTAVSLVLVSGSALFVRSLTASLHVNPGFETAHLITGDVWTQAFRYTPNDAPPFFDAVAARLTADPALRSVSLSLSPASMAPGGQLTIDGVARTMPSAALESAVDERYFGTVGLPILEGRDFRKTDDNRAPLVMIVSRSFGRFINGAGSAVGSRVTAFHSSIGKAFPEITVVGVVPDVVMRVSDPRPLVMYLSLAQRFAPPSWIEDLWVRPSVPLKQAEREIAAAVRDIGRDQAPAPQVNLSSMDEAIARQMAPQRLGAAILGALGAVALLLTALGTYVLADSMAAIRRREMGVRAALGATGSRLAGIVLGETVRLVGAGLVVGLIVLAAEAATVRDLLFRTEPLDPVALGVTAVAVLALSAVVTLKPAIGASRVDVMRVLRED